MFLFAFVVLMLYPHTASLKRRLSLSRRTCQSKRCKRICGKGMPEDIDDIENGYPFLSGWKLDQRWCCWKKRWRMSLKEWKSGIKRLRHYIACYPHVRPCSTRFAIEVDDCRWNFLSDCTLTDDTCRNLGQDKARIFYI